jgi:hypothetical protein
MPPTGSELVKPMFFSTNFPFFADTTYLLAVTNVSLTIFVLVRGINYKQGYLSLDNDYVAGWTIELYGF